MVFELLRAHYRNCGGFFSFLRPSGDGWLSKTAGVLFSVYTLVLLFFAFLSLFSISVFPENLFLPLYLLTAALAVFFTSAPLAYGLFHMGREISMLKSLPIRIVVLFSSRLSEMMIDSFLPSVAVFLPLVMNTGWPVVFPLFLLFWFSTSLLSSLFAISAGKKLFIGVVSSDAVLLASFFLYIALTEHDGPGVGDVDGMSFATVSCALLSTVLFLLSYNAFCNVSNDVEGGGSKVYRPRSAGMLKALFLHQIHGLASNGILLLKVVVGMVLPPLLLLAVAIMGGKMDGTIAVFALSLVCSQSPLSSTSYSRDHVYSDLLAALPIPRTADLFSRLLIHFAFLLPSCAAGTFVILEFYGRGPIFSAAAVFYPLAHGLASALFSLGADFRRSERMEVQGCRMEGEAVAPTFIPFLLSLLLMIFSISMSTALGFGEKLLLPSCLIMETVADILISFKVVGMLRN